MVEKVVIMGAAGRDFHNFNVYFKDNKRYNVIAFTAAQIPDIAGRLYPAELSGNLYPEGIPIHPEGQLAGLIRKHKVDLVAFSYSDVPHVEVMHKASLAMAEGADFILIGAPYTMLKSKKQVVAVCAVRTGCGKSQTTRRVCEIVKGLGKKAVVVRHPMPYGDLRNQIIQRYSTYEDFEKHQCTIEEREEYEPLVEQGIVVYAGIDYGQILKAAEKEADVVIGAVLVAGAKAPKLVTREMLKTMQKGSVLVDVAIDQGGCFETSRATTHSDPIFEVEGIVHYCVANMPGAVAKTSTIALTNATLPYAVKIANKGWQRAMHENPEIKLGANVMNGKVTYQAVAETLGLEYTPIDTLL